MRKLRVIEFLFLDGGMQAPELLTRTPRAGFSKAAGHSRTTMRSRRHGSREYDRNGCLPLRKEDL